MTKIQSWIVIVLLLIIASLLIVDNGAFKSKMNEAQRKELIDCLNLCVNNNSVGSPAYNACVDICRVNNN